MPFCTNCQTEWPAGVTLCPSDGTPFDPSMPPANEPAVDPTNPTVGASAIASQSIPDELASGSDLAPGTVVGEFTIEKKIGKGGMGAVYSAVHSMIGKRAAIKVISPELGANPSAVQRFVQEARSVNQIGHDNIVDVFAFGALPDGRNYFVMELLQGSSLGDQIDKGTPSLAEAIEIFDQVADALEAAHEHDIVHRDLKPDNVFIIPVRNGRPVVKLLDFGIAKLGSAARGGNLGGLPMTSTGMVMGTPGYLSPEQARGRNVDHRTDIYAFGCMMFEVVCGRIPFIADNAMDIVMAHLSTPPPSPRDIWPDIPPQLEVLILGMLAKDPSQRPTLAQARAVFAALWTSGLITGDGAQGASLRSRLGGRMQTPPPHAGGEVRPSVASGTSPGIAGALITSTALAVPTSPPVEPVRTRSKAVLILGVFAVLGVGGVVAVTLGGGRGDENVATTETSEPTSPAAPPAPPPTPPAGSAVQPATTPLPVAETAKTAAPDAAVVASGGTIALTINETKNAKLEVDGKPHPIAKAVTTIALDTDGPHTIAITAPHRAPYSHQLEVSGGAKLALDVKLAKANAGGPTGPTGPKVGPGSGAGKGSGTGKGSNTGPDDAPIDPFAEGN